MKLLTKRLLAVALTIAMTLGMAISAMAIDNIDSDKLVAAGLDPEKSSIIYGWIDIQDADNADGVSPTADTAYVTKNDDGTYTVDFSAHATGCVKYAMVHNYAGDAQKIVPGTSITVKSLSPFCLVGQKDGTAADDDDSSSSSNKKSSSSKKSPKTGMDESWMLWLMAAGVFAGASVVTYSRKKG